jgi:hypothetical protein
MSLNYELKKIENWEAVCLEKGTLTPETETLIFLTMSVGMGDITEENAGEFWTRANIVQKLHGPFISRDGKGHLFTVEDVVNHIGLHTNVAKETRLQWTKRYFAIDFEDGQRAVNDCLEKRMESV